MYIRECDIIKDQNKYIHFDMLNVGLGWILGNWQDCKEKKLLENITDKATQFYIRVCQKEGQKTHEERARCPAAHWDGM